VFVDEDVDVSDLRDVWWATIYPNIFK